MSNFIDRLDEFMAFKGLNDNQVTVSAHLSNGCIGAARKKGASLSLPNIERILYIYKDLNARWLITGEGEMMSKEQGFVASTDELTKFIIEENKALHARLEGLLVENTRLQEELKELKKGVVPAGTTATCVDAKKSSLVG